VSSSASCHQWIRASRRRFDTSFLINAHRNLHGPYTGAGELIRRVIGDAQQEVPELVEAYALTLLSIAPEVADVIPVSAELARSFEFSREGNSRSWTLRLANGLTDFLLKYFGATREGQTVVAFDAVDKSDPLDQEFLAVLLRRADPQKLLVRIGASAGPLQHVLESALGKYARFVEISQTQTPDPAGCTSSAGELARLYVESDCTSDDPRQIEAYSLLSPGDRKQLHLDRAAVLIASSSQSLRLGAIPLHYERAGENVDALLSASMYCMRMAYYDACLDLASRGQKMLPQGVESKTSSDLGRNILFSLLLLGRLDESETACRNIQSTSRDPALLAHSAYAMAILNARLYAPDRRNYDAAAVWIDKALEFTGAVPPSAARSVNVAFLKNTRALVEMRQGRPLEAIRLLSDGLKFLEAEAPERYEMESTILLHNRARVHVAMKDFTKAIDDLSTLLRHEPGNSDAHFDLGLIYQRLGRYESALEAYNDAIAWSPPYVEAYLNRGQTLTALGRTEAALADYAYVLDLDPDSMTALINRACLFYERSDFGSCSGDVERALKLDSRNSRMLCLNGLLHMQKRELDGAASSFTLAIENDPKLVDAWINRASARFAKRDYAGALDDLTQALGIHDDAQTRYNRGRVFQAQRRWPEAVTDYSRALELGGADSATIAKRLRECEGQLNSRG
jgi:tetratricopeptide (TPR) repeat protein